MYLTGEGEGPAVLRKGPGRRQIGWLDLDENLDVVYENPANPVLTVGGGGCFDCEALVMPTVVRVSDEELYMYYTGFGPGTGTWLDNRTGLAISCDNGETWQRWSRAPLPLLDEQDPIGIGTVFVIRDASDRWRLWYTTFRNLERKEDGSWMHFVYIKYAESDNGIHWRKPSDNIALDFAHEREHLVARPAIIQEPEGYRMWISTMSIWEKHRIGYAESADGRRWERKPAGIEPSDTGWDSEMVEYAYVIKRGSEYVMFYNGNGYGATGLGIAIGTLR